VLSLAFKVFRSPKDHSSASRVLERMGRSLPSDNQRGYKKLSGELGERLVDAMSWPSLLYSLF
jgi:hypothetical protein